MSQALGHPVAATATAPLSAPFKRTNTETIQEPALIRSNKRLRLTIKKPNTGASIATFTSCLATVQNSNEALQLLIHISDAVRDADNADELAEAVLRISEHFRREQQSAVRVKVLALLGEFASPDICGGQGGCLEAAQLVDEIVTLMATEKSPKVLSQGLHSLYKIGQGLQQPTMQQQQQQQSAQPTPTNPATTLAKIVATATAQLATYSHNIQRYALLVLGAFAPEAGADRVLELIGKYTDSQDSRVRAQALRSILTLGSRGVPLSVALYERTVKSLADDYECVRKEALHLVYELGVRNPDHLIALPGSDAQMRLIDAAFGNVCSAICDLSLGVRIQAADLLGGMTGVGNEFLHQTLDKKLMSNLRRKRSLHERNTAAFQSGEWATGKKWADDAPKEKVNVQTVSLMASGACGALVHGLEDEFLEVRTASVNSMCRLAIQNPPFAVTSLDFLVDMFNDEIEDVRLKAIASLTQISRHICLREDQLEVMLGALEDYSVEVREGLHLMLGACRVSTQACLLLVVQKVLDVLAKYPQDKWSAFGCLQKVGQKHAELCMSLVPKLLRDHPFLDCPEPNVEAPAYVAVLIMLFNAAPQLPPMLSLLPEVTVKHYGYMRDSMPSLVPHLPLAGQRRALSVGQSATGSRQFLETLLSNVRAANAAPRARQALLHAAQDNLDRLAAIDPDLSGTANYTATFLGAQLIIEHLHTSLITPHSRTPSKDCLQQLQRKCLRLQNLFSGYTLTDLLMVKQICLRASALHLVLIVKDRSQSALGPCQLLLLTAADASQFLQDNAALKADAFTTAILQQIANLTDPKPGRVFREINPIVQTAQPVVTPEINAGIRVCTARIVEPPLPGGYDSVLRVTAGLIAALPLHAEVDHLRQAQREDLRIRIKYPDQVVHLMVPRAKDLRRRVTELGEEENNWRLRTTVLLSHSVWTEAAQVDISLCLAVRPGHELELCKPMKVQFGTTAVRRGI